MPGTNDLPGSHLGHLGGLGSRCPAAPLAHPAAQAVSGPDPATSSPSTYRRRRGPCPTLLPRSGGARGARRLGSREATVAPGASSPLQRDRSPAAPPPQSAGTDSQPHQCVRSGRAGAGRGPGGGHGAIGGHLPAACPPAGAALGAPSPGANPRSDLIRATAATARESRQMGRGPG